jgi:hypothetical protein
MKSRFTIGILAGMLLTLLAPTSLKAQQETAYGTSRQPATCPLRSEPRTGRISAAQAIKYAICEVEGDRVVPQPGIANFIEIFSLQVSRPRPVSEADWVKYGKSINRSKPIYDIKGRAILYACSKISGMAPYAIGERGRNCQVWGSTDSDSINSVGECYIDSLDKWRCRLAYGGVKSIQGPPPGNAKSIGSSETQIAPNDNARGYTKQAVLKKNNQDYQGALADLNSAIQIEPNYPAAYADRGVIKLIYLKDRPGGIEDLERAAKLYRQYGNTKGYEMVIKAIEKYKNN